MLCFEPAKKRVAAFFDCQNLFKSVKALWGYSYPNFTFFMNVNNHPKNPLSSGFFFCLYSMKVHFDRLQSKHKWPTIWPTGHKGPYFVGHFRKV